MNYLLDTNVVSEWAKPQPDASVIAWLTNVDEDQTYLSVATLAELRNGVELLPVGRRRDRLEAWLADDLLARFAARILLIDERIADAWGILAARQHRAGFAIGPMDVFFAATAAVHTLTVATRNVRDFERLGVEVFNPWTYEPPPEQETEV